MHLNITWRGEEAGTMAEVVVDARIPGVDSGHSAVRAASAELARDLGANPALRAEELARPTASGSKGLASELIVSLTTSGSIAGFVSILRLWLHRDRRRAVRVTVRTTPEETTYDVTGDSISIQTLQSALEAAVRTRTPDQEPRAPGQESRAPDQEPPAADQEPSAAG